MDKILYKSETITLKKNRNESDHYFVDCKEVRMRFDNADNVKEVKFRINNNGETAFFELNLFEDINLYNMIRGNKDYRIRVAGMEDFDEFWFSYDIL